MQFFTSNSLAAHLGGGRGGQGGVPVTEGPKVSAFQGFGEGKPKVLDTVTGETLTAPPGAIHSPLGNCLRTNISNLANSTHKLCYRPIFIYMNANLSAGIGPVLKLLSQPSLAALKSVDDWADRIKAPPTVQNIALSFPIRVFPSWLFIFPPM